MQKYVSKVLESKSKNLVRLVIVHQTYRTHTLQNFRCGSKDNLIIKYPNPPKENKKQQKQVRFNERGNHASQKKCDNGKSNNDQKIYASMARMSNNDEFPSRNFGDSLQLTN